MPFANDYMLTLYSSWGTKLLVNVFYYKSLIGNGNADVLLSLFQSTVLPIIADIVPSTQTFNRIYCKNLVEADNFADEIISIPGTRSGIIDNIVNRWYFKFLRSQNGFNDGRKLIGLVADSDVTDNAPNAAVTGNLALAATAMGQILEQLFTGEQYAACNGRYDLNPPDEDHEKPWYKLSFLDETQGVSFIRLSHKT